MILTTFGGKYEGWKREIFFARVSSANMYSTRTLAC